MKKLSLVLCGVLLLLSCGGKKQVAEEARYTVKAVNLRVEPDHEKLTVIWDKQGSGLISGYNIYISPTPLAGAVDPYPEPFNTTPFPGDTDPSDTVEHFEAVGVEEGTVYYVTVRVVYPDRSLSVPSNEVKAVAGGRGGLDLGMRYSAENDGFSFVKDTFVEADDLTNDIYYYNAAGSFFVASPIRLNGFLRNTRLHKLPVSGALDDAKAYLADYTGRPADERVEVKVGDWVLLRTDDNTHALLRVSGVAGTGEDAILQLWYAYCSAPGELLF